MKNNKPRLREFSNLSNQNQIAFHDYYLKKNRPFRNKYPKEIHKIIFEDEYYGTCSILTKVVY